MNVWIAVWENRPPEVYARRETLWEMIEDDISNGMLYLSDVEQSETSIYVDDWLNAELVKIID